MMNILCEAKSSSTGDVMVTVIFRTEGIDEPGEVIEIRGDKASEVEARLKEEHCFMLPIGIVAFEHRPESFHYVIGVIHEFASENDGFCVAVSDDGEKIW